MKRKMSEQQEFEIMKLVLDKFLWVGFIVRAFGVYRMIEVSVTDGLYYLIAGAVILILFLISVVRSYEIKKKK